MESYSDCCGSEGADGYEDSGICTKCNCHCIYEVHCTECDEVIEDKESKKLGTCKSCSYSLHKV